MRGAGCLRGWVRLQNYHQPVAERATRLLEKPLRTCISQYRQLQAAHDDLRDADDRARERSKRGHDDGEALVLGCMKSFGPSAVLRPPPSKERGMQPGARGWVF